MNVILKAKEKGSKMGIKVLISWLGETDLKAIEQHLFKPDKDVSKGLLLGILSKLSFDELHLFYGQEKFHVDAYCIWLAKHTNIKVKLVKCSLHSSLDFADIYQEIDNHLKKIMTKTPSLDVSIHLSADNPSMTAVSILLGKTKYNTQFIQSNNEIGAEFVSIPFDLSTEFTDKTKKYLSLPSVLEIPISTTFADIITQNAEMKRIISKAKKVAARNVSVLIIGDTGTGKQTFAKAIHNSSLRNGQAFIAVNCAAIPKESINSELFGYIKNSESGVSRSETGYFDLADGGTLFLNECDELPADAQVRILRILKSGEISQTGGKTKKVDVRIIAATNRNLSAELAQGYFREDLFYQVAIGIISLPTLAEREGDVEVLTDYLLEKMNKEALNQADPMLQTLSEKAKKAILDHPWQGNIRELQTTLLRASIWAEHQEISKADIQDALLERPNKLISEELPEIGAGIDINKILDDTRKKYVSQALKQTAGHKRNAAKLLNLTNYQTLTNWIEKLDIQ